MLKSTRKYDATSAVSSGLTLLSALNGVEGNEDAVYFSSRDGHLVSLRVPLLLLSGNTTSIDTVPPASPPTSSTVTGSPSTKTTARPSVHPTRQMESGVPTQQPAALPGETPMAPAPYASPTAPPTIILGKLTRRSASTSSISPIYLFLLLVAAVLTSWYIGHKIVKMRTAIVNKYSRIHSGDNTDLLDEPFNSWASRRSKSKDQETLFSVFKNNSKVYPGDARDSLLDRQLDMDEKFIGLSATAYSSSRRKEKGRLDQDIHQVEAVRASTPTSSSVSASSSPSLRFSPVVKMSLD